MNLPSPGAGHPSLRARAPVPVPAPVPRLGLALALLLGAALLGATPAASAAEAFLRIREAPGESTEPAHRGWIDVTGFEQPLTRSALAIAPLRAAATASLRLVKRVDKSTPILAGACANGVVFPRAELELGRTVRNDRVVFYRVDLRGVRVRSVALNSTFTSASAPTEVIELDFESVSWVYTEFSPATGRELAYHQSQWDFLRQTGNSTSTPVGVTVRSVKQPGGKLGIQWIPEPGRRYTLRQSSTPEGPYAAVQEIAAVTTPEPESRWVELPPGLPFVFFVLEEHE